MVAEARPAVRRTRQAPIRSFAGWRVEIHGQARPLSEHSRKHVHGLMVAAIEEVLERHAADAPIVVGEEVLSPGFGPDIP